MRLQWLHKPHPCQACGVTITLAYPTCATEACRTAWGAKVVAAAHKAQAEDLKIQRRCKACKVRLSPKCTTARCHNCLKEQRDTYRERAREKAYQAYKEKLAFAHAQREIEKEEVRRIKAEVDAKEAAYRNARELARQNWKTPDGESIFEEI